MMHPIPSNDSATKWEAIDIFLFSNGQQYSPPRKYHLRNDELKWWDATLTYLARAQYGSVHSSIAMYTTDGSRVQTPLELNNGAAYVAVVPPDDFIAAGYDKYLVKASRSWEKSLQKKAEVLQNSKEDVNRSVEKITNGKLQIERPIPLGSPGNLPQGTEERKQSNSGSGGRSSFFSRRISPIVKPSDIKKKNNKIPIPMTARNSKNNSTTKSTDSKRSSIQRKESGNDKNLKQTELGLRKETINGTSTTVSKVVASTNKDLQIQSNENEITAKKDSDTDKEVMFFRNPEKEALSSCIEASLTQQVTVANDDTIKNKTASQTRLEKISEESLKTEDILKNVIKHVVERVFTFKSSNKNPNLVDNNEQIVTILKKGDSVNLKVNIEVINAEPVNTSTGYLNFNEPKTAPHVNRERGSQTNVNVELNETPPSKMKKNNQVQNTSQQSSLTRIFEKENYYQGNFFGTRPPQVVVLQCSCTYPDHSIALNEMQAINHTSKHICINNTKYIIVPADFLNEYQCCNCTQKATDQRVETKIQEKRFEESAGIQDKPTERLSCLKLTSSTTSVAVKTHTNTERINSNEPVVKIAEHKTDEKSTLPCEQSAKSSDVITEDTFVILTPQPDPVIKNQDQNCVTRINGNGPVVKIAEHKTDEKSTLPCEQSAKSSDVITEDTFVILTPQPDPVIKNLDQNSVIRRSPGKEIGKGDIVAAEPTINAPEYVITKTYFDADNSRREYIVTKHEIEDNTNGKPSYFVKRQEDPEYISTDEQKTKFLVLRKQQQANDLVDASTQTYWCDTLLQTRINEDGHYSFHLPTLQILRKYKL